MKNITYVICNTSILICTTLFERYCPMNVYNYPLDCGFYYTKTICNYLKRNKKINDNLAHINTLLMFLCKMYIYIDCITNNTILSNRVVILLVLRQLGGYLTIQPVHNDFKLLSSAYDVPAKDNNFFFMYSGHTVILVSVGLHATFESLLINPLFTGMIFSIAFIFQTLRLLASRGHYSNDIYIATLLSYLMYKAL